MTKRNVVRSLSSSLTLLPLQGLYLILTGRLLAPAQFAGFATALVTVNVASVIAVGFGNAAARRVESSREVAKEFLGFGLILGCLLMLIVDLAAPLVQTLTQINQAQLYIYILSPSIPFVALSAVAAGIRRNSFAFNRVIKANFIAQAIGFLMGAYLVVLTRSPTALVVAPMSMVVIAACINIWGLRLSFNLKEMYSQIWPDFLFSLTTSFSGLMATTTVLLPAWGIGRTFGSTMLGNWSRAYAVTAVPFDTALRSLTLVTYSYFRPGSETSRGLRSDFHRAFDLLVTSLLIIAGLMAPFMQEIFIFIFGPVWTGAGAIAEWLTVFGALTIVPGLLISSIEASGAVKKSTTGQALNTITVVVGLALMVYLHSWLTLVISMIIGQVIQVICLAPQASKIGITKQSTFFRTYSVAIMMMAFNFAIIHAAIEQKWVLPLSILTIVGLTMEVLLIFRKMWKKHL